MDPHSSAEEQWRGVAPTRADRGRRDVMREAADDVRTGGMTDDASAALEALSLLWREARDGDRFARQLLGELGLRHLLQDAEDEGYSDELWSREEAEQRGHEEAES